VTMDELTIELTHILWYIPHVWKKKDKIQWFFNCISLSFKENLSITSLKQWVKLSGKLDLATTNLSKGMKMPNLQEKN